MSQYRQSQLKWLLGGILTSALVVGLVTFWYSARTGGSSVRTVENGAAQAMSGDKPSSLNVGPRPAAAAAVTEPSSLVLLMTLGLAFPALARRRSLRE